MSEQREKNDVAIAHKALCVAHGLTNTERLVAAAILSHYNKQTGRCDPGVDRLGRMLSIDEKSVRRATSALCDEECGLFTKKSHGGLSGRASYEPQWAKFRDIVSDWDRRMISGSAPAKSWARNRAKMSGSGGGQPDIPVPDTGHWCPVLPDTNVRETHIDNPEKEFISLTDALECASDGGLLSKGKEAGADRKHRSREPSAHPPIVERRTNWHAAEAAIWSGINSLGDAEKKSILVFLLELGEDSRCMRKAIEAEMGFVGAGLREIGMQMIQDRLKRNRDGAASVH